jgi:hypothetical protein
VPEYIALRRGFIGREQCRLTNGEALFLNFRARPPIENFVALLRCRPFDPF